MVQRPIRSPRSPRHAALLDPVERRRLLLTQGALVVYLVATVALLVAIYVLPAGVLLAGGLLIIALLWGLVSLSRRDGLTVLSLVVVFVLLIPENYVLVGPLKSVGNPAQLAALFAFALWGSARILGLLGCRPNHPVRWALLLYTLATLTAFAAGMTRILLAQESAGAVRAPYPTLAVLGVGLMAIDGLETRERVETLILRILRCALVAALIGILEFAHGGFTYRDVLRLPIFTTNTQIVDDSRSGYSRIDAAAAHPIEFAVALASLAPLALHFSLYGSTRQQRRMATASLVAILVVTPLTVSRSGLLALAVGLGVYSVHLTRRQKINLVVLSALGVGLFRQAVPGLLGTLRSYFVAGDSDPSIQGRLEDYARIPGLLADSEVFGRGLGTFQPSVYFYLDNQYLGSLLEGGFVGLCAFIALWVVGIGVARGTRRRTTSPRLAGLAQALAASIASLSIAAVTFDLMSFNQTAYLLFILIGAAGALWSQTSHLPQAHFPPVVEGHRTLNTRRSATSPIEPVHSEQGHP